MEQVQWEQRRVTEHIHSMFWVQRGEYMKRLLNKKTTFTELCRCFVLPVLLTSFTLLPAISAEQQQRRGAWVDEVVAEVEESASTALRRLATEDLHVYASDITDPDLYEQIQDNEDLHYEQQVGQSCELAFNPSGPVFEGTGELNPFALPSMREAMNWLVNRKHIAEEIYNGMAQPRWLTISSAFPDYARMVKKARMLEQYYSHDPQKAESVITEEMKKLGAEKVNDLWHYENEPVEIRLLIRTEDQRREIGDYVATLLENIGFEVMRDYRSASDASPVWSSANPADGRFHIYTGAWISTVIQRDQAGNFNFYYTPRGLGSPLWQAYEPSEEFDGISDRLGRRDFGSMQERKELFERALELSLQDSVRIWLVEPLSISPRRKEVSIAADLSGGISGAYLWPYSLRIGQEIGGRARIGMADLLAEPWNPLDGSNWIFDMMFTRSTSDYGTIVDPYTGLYWPQRIEKGEVVVQEGLPVQKTHDWVSLDFSEEIQVPEDAWIDWDAEKQKFITAGEKHPDGLTARRKSVAYYSDNIFDTQWHDGSRFSVADVILAMILVFDRADEESALFDESQVPSFIPFQRNFRGVRIKSESPLIIETYSESYSLDAENNVSTWYPNYAHGPGAWHTLGIGILAEKAEELAFSNHKSDRLEIEWLNMVSGPSMEILEKKLQEAADKSYIPFKNTLGEFIDSEQAAERWKNLQQWYENKGHFWVGVGPFYLERVYPVEKNVHLKRFENYPDPADKWERYEEPLIPDVDITGPKSLRPGTEAEFTVDITYQGRPYQREHINEISFLWYDSGDNVVLKGNADLVQEGKGKIKFSQEDTEGLSFGPNSLEIAVVSNLVSLPVFDSIEFVVRP